MAFDLKKFITESRAQGIPDEVTYKYLEERNLIPTQPATPPPAPTGFALRQQQAGDAIERQLAGKQGIASTGLQIMGAGAGVANDIVGGAFGLAGKALSAITPDFIENPVKQGVKNAIGLGVQKIADSKLGKTAIGMYNELSPEAKANLDAAGNLAVAIPTIKGAMDLTKAGYATAKTALAPKPEKQLQKVLAVTRDVPLTKAEEIRALTSSGRPGGTVTKGLLKKVEVTPTAQDLEVAKTAAKYGVQPNANLVANQTTINKAVGQISNDVIVPELKATPGIFNKKQLVTSLRKTAVDPIVEATPGGMQTYDAVMKWFGSLVNDAPKNKLGLWKARIRFDQEVVRKFGPAAFDGNTTTAMKEAIKDIRQATNAFIENGLPEGSKFRSSLKEIHNLRTAADNMAYRATSRYTPQEIGTNAIGRFMKKHPTATKMIELGGAAGVGGAMVNKVIR